MSTNKCYLLYGTTTRDRGENVAQFFPYGDDGLDSALEFVDVLPGSYSLMVLENVDYDTLIVHV